MRSRTMIPALLALLMILPASPAQAQDPAPRGHLLIIGGGRRGHELMDRFVELAGGLQRANIVVIPNASGAADTAGIEMTAEFKAMGVEKVGYLLLNREAASDPSSAARLKEVTGIYFTGGDQARLTAALEGTPFHTAMKERYMDGAVIGGTSAGAAVMSKVMITGDERMNKDTVNQFLFIKRNNIVTAPGFGFITSAIIDQHFVKRKRHNRLISLVLESPKLLGVGIDEGTAIVVNPDDTFDVMGEGTVVVYDASLAMGITVDGNGNLTAGNVLMHLLTRGGRFHLGTKSILREGGDW